ncbi:MULTISPECIES: GGDEF domain-containing protein [unclassified Halomonas]|uniref:GGDEF domain-containing protein n=1 Tax=unclassified Halomonas TaxID=2609666 RepID=UPI0021E4C0B7|nr:MULTISPECIES: GGDEF domain-containing protein [unclassified Halomonas]UYG00250.1 GGDEF domain-containing protein [Halomonas sp. GD1P12]WNL38664.1 GGDEF domain-containing protein [Halomonas sp. PAMB 3232]
MSAPPVREVNRQAIAVMGACADGSDLTILDVSDEYTRFWGGERDQWLGASPRIVGCDIENRKLLRKLCRALAKGELGDGYSLSGLDKSSWPLSANQPPMLIEWRVTAMTMPGYAERVLVLVQRDISKRVEKEAELERLATTDMLTGLYNRVRFDRLLKTELRRRHRYVRPFSLIMLDIDFFKAINDSHGHDVGDQVLAKLGQLLTQNLRKVDVCARWGGEEFMILAPETSLEQAVQLAEKIRCCVRQTRFPEAGQVTISLGVVEARLNESQKSVMKRVDDALYIAKEQGRDRVSY